MLAKLVDITVRSIQTKRELFDNPLHEPIFYARHFRTWVEAALGEQDAFSTFHNRALENLGLRTPSRE